jgi:hypothetical protein
MVGWVGRTRGSLAAMTNQRRPRATTHRRPGHCRLRLVCGCLPATVLTTMGVGPDLAFRPQVRDAGCSTPVPALCRSAADRHGTGRPTGRLSAVSGGGGVAAARILRGHARVSRRTATALRRDRAGRLPRLQRALSGAAGHGRPAGRLPALWQPDPAPAGRVTTGRNAAGRAGGGPVAPRRHHPRTGTRSVEPAAAIGGAAVRYSSPTSRPRQTGDE